ncbi:MAG TPA: hypothetical protein VMC02_02380 [Steroidobacteraceae bacterium]|nr:hypothetical protein [Steroidobacteraceae bacterium]
MKKVSKLALAALVAAILGSTMTMADEAPAGGTPKGQVSSAAGPALQAAQKAFNAKKFDEMFAELDKVKNNPKKNDYDDFVMNQFLYSAYVAQNKLPLALAPLEALMGSKYTPPEEQKKHYVQAAFLYYQMQNYDKAIEFGNKAMKEGATSAQLPNVIAQAYYLKGDYKSTDRFVRGLVDEQIKAGQSPVDELLQLGLSSQVKLNDDAGMARWLELLVAYHPKPEYWQNLLDNMYRTKLTDRQLLQVYRLSAEVGALNRGSEYAEMAQLALDAGSPGEAVATLTKGFAANLFTTPADKNRNQHLLDSAKKVAATDQPTLAKTEADAANAATGDHLVGVGIGYFGYGDYERASKDIAAGLAKGMSKDSTDARLLLGIAQFKAGDKEAAVKTFKSVKGDPTSERLAALWVLRTKSS